MSSRRIIFMGTPDISSVYLQSLIDSSQNIIAVFTQPPRKKGRGMKIQQSPVHKLAEDNSISVFTPTDLNLNISLNEIKKLKPDLIVIMGYGLKIPSNILDLPKYGCINIHVSLLPRWRGASPIEYTLLNGDKEAGITIFKLIEKMDAGPIIFQDSIEIDNTINKNDLTNKLNNIGKKSLISILPNIFDGKIKFKDQDNSKATYTKKISPDMRKLYFNENVETIHDKIRAFSPSPCAWFILNNERIKIIKSNFKKGKWKPSIIINDKFHIGCNLGKICPEVIQREGKKPMLLKDFLKGYSFEIGTKINE
ncbi:methionyl-tRNA formyltransferase [Alphaproteobacteria bacterium]|nr:methionyl-tRNA formyltransferase [Alphaproteobacteria bacterium]